MEIIFEIIIEITSYFFTPVKRLEKNIALLKKEQWFAELEDDYRFNYLIWNNQKVKSYLKMTKNVEKLLKDDVEKENFKKLLTYEHVKYTTRH